MGLEILIPTFLGAASIGAGAYFNKRAQDKNYQSVIDTNATNVALNRETREWNEKQIEKQNEYNSPLQQRLRYEIAGLNPLFSQGNAGLQQVVASSSAPVTSPYQQPVDSPVSSISQLFQGVSQAVLAKAQSDNLNQNTKKQAEETSILSSDSKFRDAFNKNQLLLQSCQINNLDADTKIKEDQIPVLRAEAKNIDANSANIHQQIVESNARIALMESQMEQNEWATEQQILDYVWSLDTFDQRKQNLIAQTSCTESQAVELLSRAALARSEQQIADAENDFLRQTMPSRKRSLRLQNEVAEKQRDLVNWDSKNQQWIYNYNVEHGETDMVYRRIGAVTGSIADVAGAAGQFYSKGRSGQAVGEGSVRYNGTSSSTGNYYYKYTHRDK